jgi:DNA-binding MarR family transcriptional regulator
VTRKEQPGDRRGVLVRLTSEGRTAVDSALTDLLQAERSMLDGLDPAEQVQLIAALRVLLAARP